MKPFNFFPPPYSFTALPCHWKSHDDQKLQVTIFEHG